MLESPSANDVWENCVGITGTSISCQIFGLVFIQPSQRSDVSSEFIRTWPSISGVSDPCGSVVLSNQFVEFNPRWIGGVSSSGTGGPGGVDGWGIQRSVITFVLFVVDHIQNSTVDGSVEQVLIQHGFSVQHHFGFVSFLLQDKVGVTSWMSLSPFDFKVLVDSDLNLWFVVGSWETWSGGRGTSQSTSSGLNPVVGINKVGSNKHDQTNNDCDVTARSSKEEKQSKQSEDQRNSVFGRSRDSGNNWWNSALADSFGEESSWDSGVASGVSVSFWTGGSIVEAVSIGRDSWGGSVTGFKEWKFAGDSLSNDFVVSVHSNHEVHGLLFAFFAFALAESRARSGDVINWVNWSGSFGEGQINNWQPEVSVVGISGLEQNFDGDGSGSFWWGNDLGGGDVWFVGSRNVHGSSEAVVRWHLSPWSPEEVVVQWRSDFVSFAVNGEVENTSVFAFVVLNGEGDIKWSVWNVCGHRRGNGIVCVSQWFVGPRHDWFWDVSAPQTVVCGVVSFGASVDG